jgi:hypothetical protein
MLTAKQPDGVESVSCQTAVCREWTDYPGILFCSDAGRELLFLSFSKPGRSEAGFLPLSSGLFFIVGQATMDFWWRTGAVRSPISQDLASFTGAFKLLAWAPRVLRLAADVF